MGKKITKKQIREFLKGITDTQKAVGWEAWRAGAYTKNGEVELFVAYIGQGLDANVYNKDYDNVVDFLHVIKWNDCPLERKVSLIAEYIDEL